MKNLGKSKLVNFLFALLTSILLSVYVYSTNYSTSMNDKGRFTKLVSEKTIVLDLKIQYQFDDKKYVLVDAPEKVQVKVTGPTALVTATQSHNSIQAIVDLKNFDVGKHTVPVSLAGLNSELKATIQPQNIKVILAKRMTRNVNLQIQFDRKKVSDGYSAEVTTDIKTVKISGPEQNVNAVDHVVGYLELQNDTNTNVNQYVNLKAVDKDGNIIQVDIIPTKANVNLVVNKTDDSKTVPLKINLKGNKDDYDVKLSFDKVKVYAPKDVLDALNEIPIDIDVSNITSQVKKNIVIPMPSGVNKLSDNKLDIEIIPKN